MVAGLPGQMATLAARAIDLSEDLRLSPIAITSKRHGYTQLKIEKSGYPTYLIPADEVHYSQLPANIVVDFTTPSSVVSNATLYAARGIPFVMGTTGGDRQQLLELVRRSRSSAVIDTNMSPMMVVIKSMLEHAAGTYPDALKDWGLVIEEDHQKTKKDTSGTALTWRPLLERLGATLATPIRSVRDKPEPHTFHEVTLIGPTNQSYFQFETRIYGRDEYVTGIPMAIRFLRDKVTQGSQGEVFTMTDVLKGTTTPSST